MKTLIYDNECPLCAGYTSVFVKTGLLEKEGRINFNEVPAELLIHLNQARMHNEIPLVDSESGKTWYGIDALLELAEQRAPIVKRLGEVKVVHCLLKKIYNLISYNRKVIVAVAPKAYDCSPAFSFKYRLVFLLLGLLLNSWLFTVYFEVFSKSIFQGASATSMQLAHFSFVGINICAAILLGKQKGFEFLGQVNMLALLTLILIAPVHFFQDIIATNYVYAYFGFLCFFVMKEYVRRMKYARMLPDSYGMVLLNILCVAGFIIHLASQK